MTTKPATPQVPALDGMTPLGIIPRKNARPDDIAVLAAEASERGEHREAEKLYQVGS